MLELKNYIECVNNPNISGVELPYHLYFKTDKLYRRVLVFNPIVKIQQEVIKNYEKH